MLELATTCSWFDCLCTEKKTLKLQYEVQPVTDGWPKPVQRLSARLRKRISTNLVMETKLLMNSMTRSQSTIKILWSLSHTTKESESILGISQTRQKFQRMSITNVINSLYYDNINTGCDRTYNSISHCKLHFTTPMTYRKPK